MRRAGCVAWLCDADVGEDDALALLEELLDVGLIQWSVLLLVLGAHPGVYQAVFVQASILVLYPWLYLSVS